MVRRYAEEIANDEINHVADLRALLGAAALPCPKLNIGSAFADAVYAALGNSTKAKKFPFSPYDKHSSSCTVRCPNQMSQISLLCRRCMSMFKLHGRRLLETSCTRSLLFSCDMCL